MKKFLFLISVGLITMFATACSDDREKLYILNWGEYIDEDLLYEFEDEHNVKIVYEVVDTNEAMETKVKSTGANYDILVPSDYMIEKLAQENWLLELNKDNIPNLSHIDEDLLDLEFDKDNKYSVPYFWGTLGIMYNTNDVSESDFANYDNEWDILFDTKYKNKVAMYDSVRDSYAAALKSLGYSINETDKEKVREATAKLKEQKSAGVASKYGSDDIPNDIQTGLVSLGIVYSGHYVDLYFQLEEAGETNNTAYYTPEVGTNLWYDAMVIPKTSGNQELAEKFINFMSSPEASKKNTEYIGYATCNKTVYDELYKDENNHDWLKDPSYTPSETIIAKSEIFTDLGTELNRFYDDEWASVKS